MLHQSKCLKILEHIIRSADPLRVILFGSAVGNKERVNDLDFLIVVRSGSDTRFIAHELYRMRPKLGISTDFIVVTEEEALEQSQYFWSVVHEAETKGKELYVAETA